MSQQASYNEKAILLQGTVVSGVGLNEMNEQTVSTWFLNSPTTVETTASATYFYLQHETDESILAKYVGDLNVSAKDTGSIMGIFFAHGVRIETRGSLRSKQEEIVNFLGEPFKGAIMVENQTKQRLEYIRQGRQKPKKES